LEKKKRKELESPLLDGLSLAERTERRLKKQKQRNKETGLSKCAAMNKVLLESLTGVV